jgi:hypothetical protein
MKAVSMRWYAMYTSAGHPPYKFSGRGGRSFMSRKAKNRESQEYISVAVARKY